MSSHQHQPWVWSGAHGASGIVHPFFAQRDDPDSRYSGLGAQFDHTNTILDGSGGLLLIKWSPYRIEDDEEDSYRSFIEVLRNLGLREGEADDQSHNTPGVVHHQTSLELEQHWQTLMVVNPSTHESRVLPPANSIEVGLEFWSYNGVLANLLVDAESRTYRVTLTFPDCVCLYSSTSNAWQCQKFNQRISWGPHSTVLSEHPWRMKLANAKVNGRLFFADVVVEDSIPTMNLTEIDAEAGSWKLHKWRYPLETQLTEFAETPLLRMRGLTDHGMHEALNDRSLASRCHVGVLENFQIVECMGELYAVIPMSLERSLPMSLQSRRTLTEVVQEYPNFGLTFMPMQFMIVNMRGDGFVHGVLRILVPEDVSNLVGSGSGLEKEEREHMLMRELDQEWHSLHGFLLKFGCVAEGSVIWVALLDYVLQYDVLTGVSKTEVIGTSSTFETSLKIWPGHEIPYRRSDMKP